MSQDWFAWHENYKRNRGLQARLGVICEHLGTSLRSAPPGHIQLVSICSGDGRDLMISLIEHPRSQDVRARLVDSERRLVEAGQHAANLSGLNGQLSFIEADATDFSAYRGAAPADIVLLCGVFGHVREADLPELIQNLAPLCRTGGSVIWTRSMKAWDGQRHVELIRRLFREADFEEINFEVAPKGASGIGTHRYRGPERPLPESGRLFVFTGSDFSHTDECDV